MLLTLTTTHRPATDLGYLLHKHPDRFQTFDLSGGKAHVFYPEASDERCTVALLLDLDPIQLVRGRQHVASLEQYVNDRPYVASSYLSVALARTFATAMNGTCVKRPELVNRPLPLIAKLTAVPAPGGGEALLRRFFEPLGYAVNIASQPLDTQFPDWGRSPYFNLELTHTLPLHALLSHLYVLLPALGQDVHYYVDKNQVQKLLDKGQGWLEDHPAREEITRRYLKNLRGLTDDALERLSEDATDEGGAAGGTSIEKGKKKNLHQQRLEAVRDVLLRSGAETVVDLGCGEGKLLRMLMKHGQFTHIVGTDVAYGELRKAMDRLRYEELSERQRERLTLYQSALTYRDRRLEGFDAAAVVEVIEHLDEHRLHSFERVVFGAARPGTVVLTTPNAEYNELYGLPEGAMRHADHRFEWTRQQFANWAGRVAEEFDYAVEIFPVGPEDERLGAPSQLAVFTHGN